LQKTADELLTQLAAEGPDLTDIQQATRPAQAQQFAGAVESGEDQMTGRMKTQLQRNEDYDMTQVEILENIAYTKPTRHDGGG
jgi:multidrug efflux pump subunit AcrB